MTPDKESNPHEETTARVTDISLHESGKIEIQLTLLVDPNRLVEIGSQLMRTGVLSLSQLREMQEGS